MVLYQVYRHSIPTIREKYQLFKYNITGLKTPNGRRQPVGYLEAWLKFGLGKTKKTVGGQSRTQTRDHQTKNQTH